MFTAALFTIAKQKQSKHPSTDEWINKKWFICKMEYYSDLKGNEVRYAKWKKPDTEDHIPYNAICKKFLEQVNPQRQKIDQWLPQSWGKNRSTVNQHEVSMWGEENVLKLVWQWLHNSVNKVKTTDLYSLNE